MKQGLFLHEFAAMGDNVSVAIRIDTFDAVGAIMPVGIVIGIIG
jgi:hypothetical protein